MVDELINTTRALRADQSKEEKYHRGQRSLHGYIRIIIATTVHWFQATMYSLSTRRLRVKFALAEQ